MQEKFVNMPKFPNHIFYSELVSLVLIIALFADFD